LFLHHWRVICLQRMLNIGSSSCYYVGDINHFDEERMRHQNTDSSPSEKALRRTIGRPNFSMLSRGVSFFGVAPRPKI
jgi:hypothetical protein